MAKRSPEAKAATARNTARKGKQAQAVKAKVAGQVHAMANEANAQLDNNVIQLQPGSANPITKPENNFDLSVHLSAAVNPITADNKPNLRTIVPTEAQLKAAEDFAAMGDIAFDAALSDFKKTVAEAQWKAHVLCVAVAMRIVQHGEEGVKLVQKLLDAADGVSQRFTMVRVNALQAWLLAYAPIVYNTDQKEYRLDKNRHRAESGKFGNRKAAWIKERVERPFFMFKPAPTLQEFNLLDAIQQQIDKAKRIEKMDKSARDSKYKKVELDGLASIEKALKLLEHKAEDEKAA